MIWEREKKENVISTLIGIPFHVLIFGIGNKGLIYWFVIQNHPTAIFLRRNCVRNAFWGNFWNVWMQNVWKIENWKLTFLHWKPMFAHRWLLYNWISNHDDKFIAKRNFSDKPSGQWSGDDGDGGTMRLFS